MARPEDGAAQGHGVYCRWCTNFHDRPAPLFYFRLMNNLTSDKRKFAPATARNRDPIMAVLLPWLRQGASVLEVASGSGEHAVHMAAARPDINWQPTDPDPSGRDSIAAWIDHSGLPNIHQPLDLDVCATPWPIKSADLILCCNMIHIAPWQAAVALIEGAGRILSDEGVLFLYGPYKRDGAHTAPSNAAFDDSLRSRNADWGIRDLEAVEAQAAANGLALADVVAMPANNYCVVFRKG